MRKTKTLLTAKPVLSRAPLPLTIEVAKPRNRTAIDPLLKKSSVHADARKRLRRELRQDD